MRKFVFVFFFLVVSVVLFVTISCKSTEEAVAAAEPVQAVDASQAVVEEEVLVSTLAEDWTENVFSDADQHGYFFTTPELGKFTMVEGEFNKSGGYEKSGFGFVFGYTADENGWLSDYLRFEINTSGEYAAFASKGSSYIDLLENHADNTAYMQTSSAINTGYDTVNKLKIVKTDAASYDLFINGSKVASVTAPEGYANSDGVMAFFSVGKQNQEQFPDQPVRVTYRITGSATAGLVEK